MSLRSMTAFASVEQVTPWGVLACDLRAVNHRYLDLAVRLPDELRSLEPAVRERVAAAVSRGKVDLVLRLRNAATTSDLRINRTRLQQLGAMAAEAAGHFPGLRVELTQLLQFPGVLEVDGTDAEALQGAALVVLDAALAQFRAAREREGMALTAAIAERVDGVAGIAAQVREWMPAIRDGQRRKLQARLADLAQPADPGRVEQELVLWLQKLDVDEELDRLASHIAEIRRVLQQQAPAGRRLDFLLQEFNREANTLGSKSVDARSTNAAVELKVLIDQIREQVQNLE